VKFNIPGRPVPKGRPRVNRKTGAIYTPKKSVEYEANVAWCAESAGVALGPGSECYVTMYFMVADKRLADLDNLVKSVFDGLNQAYPKWDDRQVVYLQAERIMVERKDQEQTIVDIHQHIRVNDMDDEGDRDD